MTPAAGAVGGWFNQVSFQPSDDCIVPRVVPLCTTPFKCADEAWGSSVALAAVEPAGPPAAPAQKVAAAKTTSMKAAATCLHIMIAYDWFAPG